MAQPLEIVVRPAQSPTLRPSPRPAKAAEPDEKITEIGGGSTKEIQLTASVSVTETNALSAKEKERTVDVVRVKNPEDENQYVDMEIANRMKLSGKPPERIRYRDTEPSENVEILQRNVVKKTAK